MVIQGSGEEINTYELTYKQPYEMDYDSGPSIGDHVIEYATKSVRFQAGSNKKARSKVKVFLRDCSVLFNHYLDGDGKTYFREFVKLLRVEELKLDEG